MCSNAVKDTNIGYQDSTGHRSPLDASGSLDDLPSTPEQTDGH